MGQLGSRPSLHKLTKKDDDSFVLVSSEPEECFQFEPAESYMVSYGIGLQTSPKYKDKELGPVAPAGAEQVLTALVDVGAIPPENGVLYAASKQLEQCTLGGMKVGFQEQATKVGRNGLFVFHFSGHGIKLRNDEWSLAPVDFDTNTRETYLTADMLNQWLQEVGCKAKRLLITLDCCHAGEIADELIASRNWSEKNLGLYVISACTANETSLALRPLGHSIFTYFLARAITKLTNPSNPGQLPLHEIFKECRACSVALSSLLIKYDPKSAAVFSVRRMQPQMRIKSDGDEEESIDGNSDHTMFAKFESVTQYFDERKEKPALNDATHNLLNDLLNGPLTALEQRHVLHGKVLDAALCLMMYTIASVEVVFNYRNLNNNPNHFLIAFIHVVATLDLLKHGVKVNTEQLVQSCRFYCDVVFKQKGNDEDLIKLYDRLIRKGKRITSDCGDEESAEVGKDIPSLQQWIPIDGV